MPKFDDLRNNSPRPCDKCGQAVVASNDAVVLDILLGGSPYLITARPRHLLPTEHCEGSPSRAQYLEGQPTDPRGTYVYNPEAQHLIRDAYRQMQEGEGV